MSDWGFTGVAELSRAYANGDTAPSQVVGALLDRIERLNVKLNAFQVIYADEARQAADAADKAIVSGHRIGPFHGVPFVLKDIVDLEGRITTAGSAAKVDRISPTTATIAKRLLAGGGVLLGKTKTVEIAMGGWGTNQRMGTPWNPWDADVPRTPGGSSSGTGVSVAAGLAACGVGTDTGGSVRLPAAWCGIVGLKVTEGRLPTDGIVPLSHTLDTPGPMARSVADAIVMFETMDGRHPAETDADLANRDGLFAQLDAGVNGLRLGSLDPATRELIDADILELYDASLERLRALGAEITVFEPSMVYEDMQTGGSIISASEAYFHHGALFEDLSAQMDEDVRPRVLGGRDIKARDYIATLRKRLVDQAVNIERMRGLSAVLMPTIATAALPIAGVDQAETPALLTRPANYLAMCALSLPNGLTPSGLPGSLQIMARAHDEAMALRIGAAFEADLGSIGRPPLS